MNTPKRKFNLNNKEEKSMSMFKKVLSVVLCLSMLAGSFAMLGNLVPQASAAAGTSMVKSYDALEAKYDKFIYLAEEAYEEDADGNLVLTDYYVQPGDWITYRLYVKSDLYIGNSQPYTAYDNSFFNVKILTDSPLLDANGYETLNTNAIENANHPMVINDELSHTATSKTANGVTTIKNGYCELDVDSATLDIVMSQWTKDTTIYKKANVFTSDEWVLEWKVQVLEGLKEGTKGISQIYYNMFKYSPRSDTGVADMRRPADVSSIDCSTDIPTYDDNTPAISGAKTGYVQRDIIKALIVEDTYMVFTIGENPASSGVTKYTATFVENDDTEISKTSYEKDAAVVVPEAVDGQIGWANTRDGKLVDFETFTMPARNLTFKRVLDTDEFDVAIDLGDGALPEDAQLPENVVENDDGSLTAKVGFGETLDMTTVPAPEKEGYTAAWSPAEVTIDNINGASVKAVYTAKTYKATFYLNKGDAEPFKVVDIAYGGTLSCAGATSEGKKFGGWIDAETDQLVSSKNNVGKYNYTTDKSYYASWTDYAYSITLMVRDYENGGWKLGISKYADNGSWKINDAKSSIKADMLGWDGQINVAGISTSPDKIDSETIVNKDIPYNGNNTYYVFTQIIADVSWMIPTIDETTGELTGEYNVTTEKKSFGFNTEENAGKLNVTFSNVEVPMGYTHSGWTKNGEEAAYGNNGIALTYADGSKIEIKAVIEKTDFQIIFNLRNGDFVQKIELDGVQRLGDVITLDGDLVLKDAGGPNDYPFASADKVLLPEIGLENSKQANGGYFNRNGYAFTGWQLGWGSNETEVDFTDGIAITPDLVEKYGASGTITFNALWEAQEYELKFIYTMSDGSDSEPYIIKLKVGEVITKPTAANAPELFEKIKANAPEGMSFNIWTCEGQDSGRMPAYGREYRATYTGQSVVIYIDYNHGKTVDSEGNEIPVEKVIRRYIGGSAYYGDNVEQAQDFEAGIEQGIGLKLMNSLVGDADRPGEGYEIARWNRYHIKADGNVYDKSTWKNGINDDGSTIAKDTIIYQVEWIAHSDMFWRVYDTDGYICKAMGKDFKLYYWTKGNVCERANAQVNRNKEGLVVLMLIPTLEGWDWDRFFDCDMWSGLNLRLDPLQAPKSMFTIEAMVGLMQALGNAIKELIAGI